MKTYLVTGAAGSIGSQLVARLLPNNVIAFDNNEYGLSTLPPHENLMLAIGDIRDATRVNQLVANADLVVHCASLKRIEMAELNVNEAIKTNVAGTVNVAEACYNTPLLLISSDKAVPTDEYSLYGATKYLQEKIVLNAGGSLARLGNVMGTHGDVLEVWRKQRSRGEPLTVTDVGMKRYWMSLEDATQFILDCIGRMKGKEIFVPRMREQGILEFMREHFFSHANSEFVVTGMRPGEVLQHRLMTPSEQERAEEHDWGWLIRA